MVDVVLVSVMMKYNRVGKTDIHLSAIGFGTCQLRLVPWEQGVKTLIRAFELGVNWVHTAPDYEGAENLVARAIVESGREIIAISQGYGDMDHFEYLFENTCRIFRKQRLEMFGIACIDDREYLGENVWGAGGMVEFLLEKKRSGRLEAVFCTSHGPPEFNSSLISSGCFDAVMLPYNPLGFHLLSYFSKDKTCENIEMNRKKIFPLAQQNHVGLLIMKPLAGGLLCRGKAFPAHERFSSESKDNSPIDILRYILNLPGVCAVVPGTASVEEAEENARAGYVPLDISKERTEEIEETISEIRMTLCSRCGKCDSRCKKSLPVSWLFRDAYISSYPSETFETIDRLQYFYLHPEDTLACSNCAEKTCYCPNGIDIPSRLAQVHKRMLVLRGKGFLPVTFEQQQRNLVTGHFTTQIIRSEIPGKLKPGGKSACRIWLQNSSSRRWVSHHTQKNEVPIILAVYIRKKLSKQVPLRHDVEPGERTHFSFEIDAPKKIGEYEMLFYLTPRFKKIMPLRATLIYFSTLIVKETLG